MVQMSCWLLIAAAGLIYSGGPALSLAVNRPPSTRWARMEDADGWTGSAPPYASAAAAASIVAADAGLLFAPSSSPEGLYEVLVGRKSSLTPPAAAGGEAQTGSPDVVIGRVVPDALPSTATAVAGQSHQFQSIVPVQDHLQAASRSADQGESAESGAAAEAQDRAGNNDEDVLIKRTEQQQILPPGSFYLPAVSRNDDEYFSQSEQV